MRLLDAGRALEREKQLRPFMREKAIEIVNALLAEGMEEGKAIRVAIAKAKQWARVHLQEL